MTQKQSVKRLYALALAEGEGVGTAYEYYAKRLTLRPWLARSARPTRLLIAGLPEKYGSSLDLLLLGNESECRITVVDERDSALERLNDAAQRADIGSIGTHVRPDLLLTGDLASLHELDGRFDLAVSSEVLQRLSPADRRAYVSRLLALSPKVALFAPNAANDAHVGLSGLAGVQPEELEDMLRSALHPHVGAAELEVGYIDMPPFPPGITRTEEQRQEATTGFLEAIAMRGLEIYARAERLIPTGLQQRWAHIVYAFLDTSPR